MNKSFYRDTNLSTAIQSFLYEFKAFATSSKPLRPITKGKKELTGETRDIETWKCNCQVLSNDTYSEWTVWVSGKTDK